MRTAEAIPIEGVRVPFLSLEMLIKSKTTCREQDRADSVRLGVLLELKRQGGDARNGSEASVRTILHRRVLRLPRGQNSATFQPCKKKAAADSPA